MSGSSLKATPADDGGVAAAPSTEAAKRPGFLSPRNVPLWVGLALALVVVALIGWPVGPNA